MRRIHMRAALAASTAIVLSTSAMAQEETENASDIIVTARRVEERLQDVPISMTVFNQQQIDNRNVVNAKDLAAFTPSLSSNTRFGADNASFAIRGFTQELRTSASVAIYFADVVAPRGGNGGVTSGDGAGPGSFFDLQNVQVLKGPQGTLFGRNTTGGAVLLVPHKPTDNLEGYVEGTYGNFDAMRLQGVLNIPLSDIARLRVGFDRNKRDGYVKNVSGVGPRDFSDIDYIAARASLVVDLTPDFENYTIVSYNRLDTHGTVGKLTDCFPGFPLGTLACNALALQGDGFYSALNGMPNAGSYNSQWQVINTATWKAADNLTVKSITSYSQLRSILRSELFGTYYVIPKSFGPIADTGALAGSVLTFANSNPPAGRSTANQYSVTQELQFQGNFGSRMIWQAGGYYETSKPLGFTGTQAAVLASCTDLDALQCTDPIGTILRRPGTASVNYALAGTTFQNIGLYAQSTYDLTDRLKLTGGIRYTFDETSSDAQQVVYRFFAPNMPTGFCTLAGASATPGVTPADCETRTKQKSNAPTWLIGLDYKPADDIMLYGKYSRGYRQGSVNYSAPPGFQTFGPEKVDTFEIGAKTSFRGAVSGTFNIAAFYNDFSDQQLAVGLISSTNRATPTQVIVNGGKSRIAGVEVDGSVSPFTGFTVDGSYAYLDTKLKSLVAPVLPADGLYDIFQFSAFPGSRLAYTPKHKGTVSATYRLPLDESIGEIALSGTYTYTSSILVVQGPYGTLPSTNLVNANLSWNKIAGGPIDASFFMTNLTDEKYYTNIADQSRSGFLSKSIGEPRIYGVRVRVRFGD